MVTKLNDGWMLASVIEKTETDKTWFLVKEKPEGGYEFQNLSNDLKEEIKKDGGILTYPYETIKSEDGASEMRIYVKYEVNKTLEVQRKDSNG